MNYSYLKNVAIGIQWKILVFGFFPVFAMFGVGLFSNATFKKYEASANQSALYEQPQRRVLQDLLLLLTNNYTTFEQSQNITATSNIGESNSRIDHEHAMMDSDAKIKAYFAALKWGSESEAFRLSNNGSYEKTWSQLGHGGSLVVAPPRLDYPTEYVLNQNIIQASTYYDAYYLTAIAAHENYHKVVGQNDGRDTAALFAAVRETESLAAHARLLYLRVNEGLSNGALGLNERIQVQNTEFIETGKRSRVSIIYFSCLVFLFGFFYTILYLRHIIVMPLKKLTSATEKFGLGNYRVRSDIETNDEFGKLSSSFNAMAERISNNTQQLREEQARLLTSINSLSLGFILISPEHDVFMHNSAAEKLFNLTSATITIDNIAERLKDVFDLNRVIDESIMNKKQIEIGEVNLGGSVLRVIVVPVSLSTEQLAIGCVLIFENITEAKMLERSRDEFFSIASHELRTPLTAIRGNSSLLQTFYADKINDPEVQEMIADILQSSERLIRIVNDFLSVSRLEQKRMEFKNENFDVTEIIRKTINEVYEIAAKKNIEVKMVDPEISVPVVNADPDRVKQVVMNLLGNAINYSEKGVVRVNVTEDAGYARISVHDDGIGIPLNNQPLLFRKFQQANDQILTRNTTSGTGLGLYICKLMIEHMGGTIGLEKSAPGQGSTFFFTIPLAKN